MKLKLTALSLFSVFLFSCVQKQETLNTAVKVEKQVDKKVLIHMMTWFWTDENNGHPEKTEKNNTWFGHWTMDTKNPAIVDSVTGQREIATHYYPLTGPYASSDKNIIEYQLLLMKLAGIDGIIFNYTTLNPHWDFPMLIAATDSIAKHTKDLGLEIAIMYEDQHVRDNVGRGFLNDSTALLQAKEDMKYINERYFSEPNYIKIDGRPILLDFGPQYFNTEEEWGEIFSVLEDNQPAFYSLWYHGSRAGENNFGEFAWIHLDGHKDDLSGLRHFHTTYELEGDKMAVAYPGFVDFYKEGGWGEGIGWSIPHRGDSTLIETLDLAINSESDMIQLATWNDYGEGTMFEPTVEFGFTFLSSLQKELGVKGITEKDLVLVYDLYKARIKYEANEKVQKDLDLAASYLASLSFKQAEKILKKY